VALSVTASAWVSSGTSVTPADPFGLAVGDYVVLTLVSKYDDAILGGAPAGWTDLGTAINTGRTAGTDNGNLRMRVFGKIWQAGDTMPALAPTPNNVSTVKASAYRAAAGKTFDVVCHALADNTTGTPLAGTTAAIPLAPGDHLLTDMVLNGDAPTWGTTTVTAPSITFGTITTPTADANTTTGTDLRMRAMNRVVSAGTASSAVTVSTVLAGTTTNAVGTIAVVRIREVDPPPVMPTGDAALALNLGVNASGQVGKVGAAALALALGVTAEGVAQSAAAFTVTARHAVNTGSTSGQTATTNSATPTADSLLLAAYGVESNNHSTLPTLGAPTGGALSFDLVTKDGDDAGLPWADATAYNSGSALYRAQVGSSPSAHTLAFDAYAAAQVGYYSGVAIDVTGHDTSNPVVQSKVNGVIVNPSSSSASGTVTLDATPSAGNLLVVAIYAAADGGGGFTSPTAGAGKAMTAHHNQNASFTQIGMWSRICDGTESATITCADLGNEVGTYIFHAVEIRPAGGGTPGEVTGSATLPLTLGTTASGTVGKAGATTAALNLATNASGTVGKAGDSTAALNLGVNATGAVGKAGASSAALTLAMESSGTVGKVGAANPALTLAVVATGVVNANPTGQASIPLNLSVLSSGFVGKVGAANLPLTLGVSAAGRVGKVADASIPLNLGVNATGSVGKRGDATLPLTFAVSSTGVVGKRGSASLGVTFGITASGATVAPGQGGAVIAGTFTVVAVGVVGRSGAASLPLTLALAATGAKGVQSPTSLGATFGMQASGQVGVVADASPALNLGVNASGAVRAQGGAALVGSFAVEASGQVFVEHEGDAALPLTLAVAAAGAVYEGRPPGLPNTRLVAWRERVGRIINVRERTKTVDVRERGRIINVRERE
jgi:hypothetical protein